MAYMAKMERQGRMDLLGLSQQFQGDPAGFQEVAESYLASVADTAPDEFRGDVYQASDLPRVARTLAQATDDFAASSLARSAFGDDVVDHYAHFHRVEVDAFDTAVTDWERRRYFERI